MYSGAGPSAAPGQNGSQLCSGSKEGLAKKLISDAHHVASNSSLSTQSRSSTNNIFLLPALGDGGNGIPATPGGGGDGGNHFLQPSPQRLFTIASSNEPIVLTLASFAVTKMAYVRLTKLFRDKYYKDTGVDVRFRLSFAGSGVQARAIIDGLPADIAALALALDIDRIVEANLISPSWRSNFPNNSVVCETTVAFVVRKDNPKDITTWEDLIRPDVEVVIANPKTAGVARWIFLGLWGHKMKKGDAASIEYVTQVFENVVVQPRDAREASDVFFKQKVGDVLLTYENEAILTNQAYKEKALPYHVPKSNIRIECPLALVDEVLKNKPELYKKAAEDFGHFLFTPVAQEEFAKVGFRVNPAVSKQVAAEQSELPPTKLWNVDRELGGWHKAQEKFFDAGKILDQIQVEVSAKKLEQRKLAAAGGKSK